MDQSSPSIYQVAVPVPLRRVFDYTSDLDLVPGQRVLIPFGKRETVGVIVSRSESSEIEKIRSIKSALDDTPAFPDQIRDLLEWASRYYHHPIGEVLSAAMPVLLRQPISMPDPKKEIFYSRVAIESNSLNEDASGLLKSAPAQKKLFEQMIPGKAYAPAELNNLHPGWRAAAKGLIEKGLIEKSARLQPSDSNTQTPPNLKLTDEQQLAADQIIGKLDGFHSFVLQGITGSGKTEVYLEAAKRCIANGKQVLFLVPEISLTPQLVSRVRQHLGARVYAMHSGMTDKERYQSWWMAKNGLATALLGTRSAVFSWLQNPGLIIVDEEHDQSYKQQDGFRYHARDLAIKRASLEEIPIVLGSATPSLESLHNTNGSRHQLLRLSKRIGKAKLPEIEIIDTHTHPLDNGVCQPVINAIESVLSRNEQVIVYINRRGYAPVVHCYECGWQAVCQNCSARLTYHQNRKQFRCHHCGHRERFVEQCPECDTPLFFAGAGTQRIEQTLAAKFPDARFCRLDRDQANTTRKLYQQLDLIQKRQVDVIVGTQLITKGHDFAGVSLVCVINADQGLFSVDFRAPEVMFQQLLQVAGRAGRAEGNGKVLIQTAHPKNPYIQMLTQHDYNQFSETSLIEREQASYPPYAYFALFRAESTDYNAAATLLGQTASIARQFIQQQSLTHVEVFSPIPSPLEKLAGRFRVQLLIRSQVRKQLHQLLQPLSLAVESQNASRSVRWSLDIDPMDMA